MESLFNLPMVQLEFKRPFEDIDFTVPFSEYIRSKYEENPKEFVKDINEFNNLRRNAISVSYDLMGCHQLKAYLSELKSIKNRFPMNNSDSCAIRFSWINLFDEMNYTYNDVRFEERAILYNIGVLHLFLGGQEIRRTDSAIKESCNNFQNAAWCFQAIIDMQVEFDCDLCTEYLVFILNVALAQAQECVFRKSSIDKRKFSVIAKVSSQIYRYYDLALSQIEKRDVALTLSSKMMKDLRQYVYLKSTMYKSVTYYYNGQHLLDLSKYGESLANLYKAKSCLDECSKSRLSSFDQALCTIFKDFVSFIDKQIEVQKRDNDFVYHEKIPDANTIEEIEPANLVKQLHPTFADSNHLFSKLIPIEIVEVSSLYSLETGKMLKTMNDLVQQRNKELDNFMNAIKFDIISNKKLYDINTLPEKLLECCASINIRQNLIEDIPKMMKDLIDISFKTKDSIEDLDELIQQADVVDDAKEKILNIKENYVKLKKNFHEAEQSNVTLHTAFKTILDNLKLLLLPVQQLQEKIPSVDPDILKADDMNVSRQQFDKLLSKIDEMKAQREQLINRLKKNIDDDNIIQLIIAKKYEQKELFERELKKHDEVRNYLMQNLTAQETILRGLSDVNAQLTFKRKELKHVTQTRHQFIDSLISSYESVDNCCEKCQDGIDFFKKLQNTSDGIRGEVTSILDRHKENQKLESKREQKQYETQILVQPQQLIVDSFGNQPYFKKPASKTNSASSLGIQEIDRPKLKDFLSIKKPNNWPKEDNNGSAMSYPAQKQSDQQPYHQYIPPQQYNPAILDEPFNSLLAEQMPTAVSHAVFQKPSIISQTNILNPHTSDNHMALPQHVSHLSDKIGQVSLGSNHIQHQFMPQSTVNLANMNYNPYAVIMPQQHPNQIMPPYQLAQQSSQFNVNQAHQPMHYNYSQPSTPILYSNNNNNSSSSSFQAPTIEFKKPQVQITSPIHQYQQQSNQSSQIASKQQDTFTTDPNSVYRPGFFNKSPYSP